MKFFIKAFLYCLFCTTLEIITQPSYYFSFPNILQSLFFVQYVLFYLNIHQVYYANSFHLLSHSFLLARAFSMQGVTYLHEEDRKNLSRCLQLEAKFIIC